MLNIIVQEMVPLITALVVMLNSIGGIFGVTVVPYNPERVEVTLGSNVNSDVDEVLEYYNAAVKNTGFVLGKMSSDYTYVNVENTEAGESMQMYFAEMEKVSNFVFAVPGEGEIQKADVTSAKMSSEDGKRVVIIRIKDYMHGVADDNDNNPITNALGAETDLEDYFLLLGMTGDFEFVYSDVVISCVIDEDSGKIIYGDWDYTCITECEDVVIDMSEDIVVGDLDFTMECHIDI